MRTYQVFFVASILLFTFFKAQATHVLGGQISATSVSNQAFTYQLKFTLYTDLHTDIEFGNVEITFGHGDPINIDGENDFQGEVPNEDSLYRIDTLIITHTFPGAGTYLISLREFNRSADIANMRNSVNTPFYVETQLTLDPKIGENRSPLLSDSVVFNTHVHTRFVHDIGAVDPDGDSLSYALVVPKENVGRIVDIYTFPDQFDTLFAENPSREDGSYPPLFAIEEGKLIWDAPTYGGEYAAAFRVKEWRKVEGEWTEIGYVTRDLKISVQDTINHTNGIDYFDYADYITGTEYEVRRQDIVLYPNPTDGNFHVKIDEPWRNSLLTVLDIRGRMVYQASVSQGDVILQLPHLSSGLYVLTLQQGNKKRSFTFVKQ